MEKTCKLVIDNSGYEFKVKGNFFWGKDEVLYKPQNNIISKTEWSEDGYSVVNAFNSQEFDSLKKSILNNVIKAIKEVGLEFNESEFTLENYHKVVKTDADHNAVINITRNLENEDFDFDIDALAERFGDMLGYKLTSWIKELNKTHIQIRISRPSSLDINPPHRDGYLSYWSDIVNVWIPVSGCNEKASLPVVPGSHKIPENNVLRTESKGAEINGNVYFVPCILESKDGPFNMIRPLPQDGEAILFTPFLIHGAAVNQNTDITRMSIELRLPKADIQ